MRNLIFFALLGMLLVAFVRSSSFGVFSTERSLHEIIETDGIKTGSLSIRVEKSVRKFKVISGSKVLKTYKAVLGQVPEGDKRMEGDRKTPEGHFSIRAKYPHAKWHKFIWIDYPTEASWKKFNARQQNGSIPESARIGGEIGIHGVPAGMDFWIDLGSDWTLGCVALKNSAVDELYEYVEIGTPIEIVP